MRSFIGSTKLNYWVELSYLIYSSNIKEDRIVCCKDYYNLDSDYKDMLNTAVQGLSINYKYSEDLVAYYKSGKNKYQNSDNFIEAVKKSRKYEKSQDKLIIVAGACQSNYEELIRAGANFASSPKRINIHALDPAILATSLAFSDRNKSIDLIKLIEKTKYGSEGMGGIITNGTMYVGYPR